MNKSFKMVVLLGMCDDEGFRASVSMDDLVRTFRLYFREDAHRTDVMGTVVEDVEAVDGGRWSSYLIDNPIRAWTGANTAHRSMYFAHDSGARLFRYMGPMPSDDPESRRAFLDAVRDRAIAKLQMYWRRPGPMRYVYPVIPVGSPSPTPGSARADERGMCVMFGKERSGLPTGWHPVRINGRMLYGKFVEIALNMVKAEPSDKRSVPNLLMDELRALFGGEVPARPRVRFVKDPASAVWELMAV